MWSLPSTFVDLLSYPVEQAIDTLLPAAPNDTPTATPTATPKADRPTFLAALDAVPDALTAKGAAAYSSTGSALVDLFYHLTPGTDADTLGHHLERAWAEDPVVTLKIIFNARSIHEGKGFKQGFFLCAGWLWEHHPRTLLANLWLVVEGTCERKSNKAKDEDIEEEWEEATPKRPAYPARPHGSFNDLADILLLAINLLLKAGKHHGTTKAAIRGARVKRARLNKELPKHLCPPKAPAGSFEAKLERCHTRKQLAAARHERAQEMLSTDKKFQALYLVVVDLYMRFLKADLERLAQHNKFVALPDDQRTAEGYTKPGSSPHLFGMSYAAKWAPTPGKSADKQLNLATALAVRFFPDAPVKVARQMFQTQVLAPLRSVLAVPEVAMSAGKWGAVDYSRVPALSMKVNLNPFVAHDRERLTTYIRRKKVAGASMFPHELLLDALRGEQVQADLACAQWKSLVDSVRAEGQLSNCIAIADVSGSMGYLRAAGQHMQPIEPCIALTLLMTELASPPWNGAFITFSSNPAIQHVDSSETLKGRALQLARADWGMSTDYFKAFKLVLDAAVKAKLAPEAMVKRVFVFSDMQFDASGGTSYGETEHQAISRAFKEAGYELPELVYWNLAGEASKPARADTPGVALVSGVSGAMMKYFLRQGQVEDDDWVVAEKGEENEGGGENKEGGGKKDDALTHVMAIVGAKCFDGVKVVD